MVFGVSSTLKSFRLNGGFLPEIAWRVPPMPGNYFKDQYFMVNENY